MNFTSVTNAVVSVVFLILLPVNTVFSSPPSPRQEKTTPASQQYVSELKSLNEKIQKSPNDTQALRERGRIHVQQKNFDAAQKDFEKQYLLRPSGTAEVNNLAWFLATVPSKKHRDPKKAIDLAKAVCKQTDYSNATYLDTLAAAYAANNDFDAAIITQKAAEAADNDPISRRSKTHRLDRYKAGQAVENGFTNMRLVAVNNTSSSPVTLICTEWFDKDGNAHSATYSWSIAAGQFTDLLVDAKPMLASKVHFRVKTADGSTPVDATRSWISNESDAYLILNVTQETIPAKVAAANPGQKNMIDAVAGEVREIGKAIQENKEAIDNAKKIVEAFRPATPPAPPAPRRAALSGDLSLNEIVVASQKFDGTGWDVGFGLETRPDISVKVTRTRAGRPENANSGEHPNTFSASPNKHLLRVQEGDILKIEVFDKDVLGHDLIGECQVTIDANFFQQSEVNWTFGQVESFKFTINR